MGKRPNRRRQQTPRRGPMPAVSSHSGGQPRNNDSQRTYPLDEKSLFVTLTIAFWHVLAAFNLYLVITWISRRARESRIFLELYLLAWTATIAILLFLPRPWLQVGVWLAGYRVFLLLHSRGAVFVKGGIVVRNVRAAVLTVLLNIVEIINCFAVLILYFGEEYTPVVGEGVSAVYLSTVTFLTLGFGDIHPREGSWIGQLLTIAELWCFLFFLVMLGPLVFGLAGSHYRSNEQ